MKSKRARAKVGRPPGRRKAIVASIDPYKELRRLTHALFDSKKKRKWI